MKLLFNLTAVGNVILIVKANIYDKRLSGVIGGDLNIVINLKFLLIVLIPYHNHL